MRGYWHMVEVVLAGIVIVSFLTTISVRQTSLPTGPGEILAQGYEILKNLDKRGELRNYAVTSDNAGLDTMVRIIRYNHSVKICDYQSNCDGSTPSASNIYTSTYYVAGNNSYQPYEVILYLW